MGLFCMCFWGCPSTQGLVQNPQPKGPQLIPDNYVYESSIRTVQLYKGEYEASYPVLYQGQRFPWFWSLTNYYRQICGSQISM